MEIFVSASMANVLKAKTHLKHVVFISQKPQNKKGFARIKVNSSSKQSFDEGNNFEVLFDASSKPRLKKGAQASIDAKELSRIFVWTELNKQLLLDYWFKRNNDTADVLSKLLPMVD